MALPALVKTWRFRVNQALAAQASATLSDQNLLVQLLHGLLGGGVWTDSDGTVAAVQNPWTVVQSNGRLTGPTMGVNVITTTGEATWAVGGNRWWIILQRVDGVQVCLYSPNTATTYNIGVKFSVSGAFAGGTATVVPTAADEVSWAGAGNWSCNTNGNRVLHILHSTDGLETRAIVCQSGYCITTLHMGNIKNPKAAITTPFYLGFIGIGAVSVDNHTVTGSGGLMAGTTAPIWLRYNGLSVRLTYTAEGYGTALLAAALSVASEFDSEWCIFPLGLAGVSTVGGRGRAGQVHDIWVSQWAPRITGDQFPAAAPIRQFTLLGGKLYPWNKTASVVS